MKTQTRVCLLIIAAVLLACALLLAHGVATHSLEYIVAGATPVIAMAVAGLTEGDRS